MLQRLDLRARRVALRARLQHPVASASRPSGQRSVAGAQRQKSPNWRNHSMEVAVNTGRGAQCEVGTQEKKILRRTALWNARENAIGPNRTS